MRFSEAIALGYKGYFRTSGRASRAEYWLFWVFTGLTRLLGKGLSIAGTALKHNGAAPAQGLQTINISQLLANPGNLPALKPLLIQTAAQALGAAVLPAFIFLFLALVVHLVFFSAITPLFSVQVRRLHDAGRSGWWTLPGGLGCSLVAGGVGGLLAANPFLPRLAYAAFFALGLPLAVPFILSLIQPGSLSSNKYGTARPARPVFAPPPRAP